jgi:hypothetical protein
MDPGASISQVDPPPLGITPEQTLANPTLGGCGKLALCCLGSLMFLFASNNDLM